MKSQSVTAEPAQSPPPPVSPTELIAAYGRKIDTLRARDLELCQQQIALEKREIQPAGKPPEPSDESVIASRLLNGFAAPVVLAKGDGERLREILVERGAIKIAMGVLETKDTQTRALAVAEVMQSRDQDWREIARRRAESLMALRAANRDAIAFRKDVIKAGGGIPAGLILDFTGGIFGNIISDPGYNYLQQCNKYGVITDEELKDALSRN